MENAKLFTKSILPKVWYTLDTSDHECNVQICLSICYALFVDQLFIATIRESNDNSLHCCHSAHMHIAIQKPSTLGTTFIMQELHLISSHQDLLYLPFGLLNLVNEEIPTSVLTIWSKCILIFYLNVYFD